MQEHAARSHDRESLLMERILELATFFATLAIPLAQPKGNGMRILQRVAALSVVACLTATGALAQQTNPPATPPAKTTPAPSAATKSAAPAAADKASISKACSQQADAKGLKGKARKKFRSECKKHGGNAE